MIIIRLILKDGERPVKNRHWFDTRALDCTLVLEGQFVRVGWDGAEFLIPLTSISHLEIEAAPVITPVKKRRRKTKTPPPPLAPSNAPQVEVSN